MAGVMNGEISYSGQCRDSQARGEYALESLPASAGKRESSRCIDGKHDDHGHRERGCGDYRATDDLCQQHLRPAAVEKALQSGALLSGEIGLVELKEPSAGKQPVGSSVPQMPQNS